MTDNSLPAGTASPATPVPGQEEERYFIASQWQLMWWKFVKHRLAVVSGLIIVIMYVVAVLAPVVAPYDPFRRDSMLMYAPPQRIRWTDETGFHLRPFVYGLTQVIDKETFQIS